MDQSLNLGAFDIQIVKDLTFLKILNHFLNQHHYQKNIIKNGKRACNPHHHQIFLCIICNFPDFPSFLEANQRHNESKVRIHP